MTANLIINHGWWGYLFDGNEHSVRAGREFFAKCPDTSFAPPQFTHAWITAENVNEEIARSGVSGPIDLLSLDMDGVDYWVWKAIEVVQPQVVVCETVNSIPGDRALTVPYDASFTYQSEDFRGASLAAMCKSGRRERLSPYRYAPLWIQRLLHEERRRRGILSESRSHNLSKRSGHDQAPHGAMAERIENWVGWKCSLARRINPRARLRRTNLKTASTSVEIPMQCRANSKRPAVTAGIVEREEHGTLILAPASGTPFRRVIFVNSYGGKATWEKIKEGLLPANHLWGCIELARLGYEVAIAEPLRHFYLYRRPFPHDLRLLGLARNWLRADDIIYCGHTLLYWLPLLKMLGALNRHVVSLTYAREELDFSRSSQRNHCPDRGGGGSGPENRAQDQGRASQLGAGPELLSKASLSARSLLVLWHHTSR